MPAEPSPKRRVDDVIRPLEVRPRRPNGVAKEIAEAAGSAEEMPQEFVAGYHEAIGRAPVIVYTSELGPHGRWRFVSPQVEAILGYTAEEWMSSPTLWAERVHPDDRQRVFSCEDERYIGVGASPVADYRMIRRDGTVVWVMDEGTLERDPDGTPVWHGVIWDITERKEAEHQLGTVAAQQAAVAGLGQRAIEGIEPHDLMAATVELVAGIEGVEFSCIWELVEDGRALKLRTGLEHLGISGDHSINVDANMLPGATIASGGSVLVNDWETKRRVELPAAFDDLGVRSSLSVLIDGKDRAFGVIDVHSIEAGRFAPHDSHFVQGAANVLANAIDRRRADESLRHRLLHDALTGLPNRELFMETLERTIERAEHSGRKIGVLFLDLDHFKLINDSLGHHAGDEVLRLIAPRLSESLRPPDTIARFGGDEFAILIADLVDEEEALVVAERVIQALEKPVIIDGSDHLVTASVGVAMFMPGDEKKVNAESLIRDADTAMYRAKEGGRARPEVFGEELRTRSIRKLDTQRELRHALERDELVLHFQPIASVTTGSIVGTEALVRWQHPKRGLLPPSDFIPVASESSLIEQIGSWVLEQACAQTSRWNTDRSEADALSVSVNVAARQVTHHDLAATVESVLGKTGMQARNLCLEITESVLLVESAGITETLERLRITGTQLFLDDFGTGYSALAYLNRFPLNGLKIDRSFIERIGFEQEQTAIVRAIVMMAGALSLEVVAEGVTTGRQLSVLREIGCERAQGYLIARPMPASSVGNLLS